MNSTYTAVSKVRAGHAIPHLLWSSSAGLYVSDPTFDILNTAYLISLLPLPLFIGLVGLLFVFVFIIAIVLRLLLLTCKFLVRKCQEQRRVVCFDAVYAAGRAAPIPSRDAVSAVAATER